MPRAETATSTALKQTPDLSPNISEAVEATAEGNPSLEMPSSHPEVDAKTISVEGLIKSCGYFANMAARNPELAKTKATEAVQHAREHEAMRESGMSDGAVKKQQWAAMRQRHKQKIKAGKKQEIESEVALQHPAEQKVSIDERAIERSAVIELTDMRRDRPEVSTNITPIEAIAATIARLGEQLRETVIQKTMPGDKQETPGKMPVAVTSPETPEIPEAPTLREVAAVSPLEDTEVIKLTPAYSVHETTEPGQDLKPADQPGANQKQDVLLVVADDVTPLDEQVGPRAITAEVASNNEYPEPVMPAAEFTVFGNEAMPASKVVREFEQIEEPVNWMEEADTDPLQVYEDFSEALHLLVATAGEHPIAEQEAGLVVANEGDLASTDEDRRIKAAPGIAVVVTESLGELKDEDKVEAALVLTTIAETVNLIKKFEDSPADPEAIETIQAELEDAVITLFKRLSIEYERDDVEQFIAILSRPDFQLPQPEAKEFNFADLEHDGTQEAKIHFSSASGSIASTVGHNLELLLGTFALLNAKVRQVI
ncbi:MAG TPA: hypothetical protein VHB72_02540 [Candidatus Saccharimonadales bacterium]|nr:hypothetical protein [Candidatus Saccharimonadales bacterium]